MQRQLAEGPAQSGGGDGSAVVGKGLELLLSGLPQPPGTTKLWRLHHEGDPFPKAANVGAGDHVVRDELTLHSHLNVCGGVDTGRTARDGEGKAAFSGVEVHTLR